MGAASEDAWLFDLGWLPAPAAVGLSVFAACLLIAFAVDPDAGGVRRAATVAVCGALVLVACHDAWGFYVAWAARGVAPAVPAPFSALVASGFAHIATPGRHVRLTAVLAVAVAVAFAFPLSQVLFFGTTDYRRPADVVVVLGAKAYTSGRLSTSLEDRVRTAADLYRAGLVPRVVMSGATGVEGIDETVAMRDRAIELGVPADAIVRDPSGADTGATVAGTVPLLQAMGATRVLAVSQFYHLPRVKAAYRAAGVDVQTVPATVSRPIPGTALSVLREVAGFWVYWGENVGRSYFGRSVPPSGRT
jgi:vancomycin permeability regulator SanA